jgi:hypothetical protein
MSNIFFVLAAVCFGLGAAKVAAGVDWLCAGLALVTIGLWLA